ncbi:MAG: ribonuclease HII [Endomicrobiales bacterium]
MGLFSFDHTYRDTGYRVIAGVDEAGRGPWAGPVVAAAVILPESPRLPGLNDSKKLSSKKRDLLFDAITACARSVGVGIIDVTDIDTLNILQATFCAMRVAIEKLSTPVDALLVDGSLSVPGLTHTQKTIIGGDGKSACIAAASIIAKVTRDRIMIELSRQYPQYQFHEHKGYGTKVHYDALVEYGPCPIHRKSFEPVKRFLDIV